MITIYTIWGLFLAYLIGSIPTAVWLGRYFYNIDIREFGSGNAGATNAFRVLGKKAGISVMIFDVLKGFLCANLAYVVAHYDPGTDQFINFQITLGMSAVVGHIFPVFAGFRGGKGIATLLGMVLAIHPYAALLCVAIFVITLLLTSYVSLSSIAASISFPLLMMFHYTSAEPTLRIFGVAVAILVITTHQKNIERLWKGKERKAKIFKRKQP